MRVRTQQRSVAATNSFIWTKQSAVAPTRAINLSVYAYIVVYVTDLQLIDELVQIVVGFEHCQRSLSGATTPKQSTRHHTSKIKLIMTAKALEYLPCSDEAVVLHLHVNLE